MNEIGYHGTCLKYRHNIEENGLDPSQCKYRRNHWLGQGVYFFDDYEKAMWWASTTSFQNGNCGGVIFQANIEAMDEEVLDLDNGQQLDIFITASMETLSEIEKYCGGKMPIFDDDSFRAVFFDYYKEQNNISVIIGTFSKKYAGYTKKEANLKKRFKKN